MINHNPNENSILTTNQGSPVGDDQHSRTAGSHGPTLLEDYHLIEKMAHFDRERIPERVVHARGAGAYGIFRVSNSMKNHTKADFLQNVGEETSVFVRFSTVIHPSGSPETIRDPRGFAVKFYTKEGNYDLVGNNLPVFFIRDAIKFPDMVHSLKPAPDTNIQDPNRYWDFMTLTPESTHMLTWVFSDLGTPANYREMEGFSVHAFKWINGDGKITYVKYHWKPTQGVRSLSTMEAAEIQKRDFNHATKDLYEHIAKGEFPEWDLHVQLMPVADLENFSWDPLDPTKVWPEDLYPLQLVGRMTLNRNPQNYFAEVEQSAFAPGVVVPGIEPSEDKLLQGRLFSYPDTQRYRLGPNYLQLPVNCPYAARVQNNQRDGAMQTQIHTNTINYYPSRHIGQPTPNERYKESETRLEGVAGRQKIFKTDDFTQAGEKFRSYSSMEQEHLIQNLASDLRDVHEQTKLMAICNFYRADASYGKRLADALGIDLSSFIS